MPDLESLRVSTSTAARGAFGRGIIDKKVLHRLQDGTVSKYDVEQSRRLVEEQKAIYRSMSRNKEASPEALKRAQANQRAAYELESAVQRQYDQQGSIETGVENTKDWWNGSAW